MSPPTVAVLVVLRERLGQRSDLLTNRFSDDYAVSSYRHIWTRGDRTHLLGVGGARSFTAGQIAWPSVVLMELEFTGQLWEYQGEAPWVFVTLPPVLADEIDEHVTERRGFGSVKVEVTIGESTWRTSIFPDKASGSFVLPIKREIRQAERVDPGDSTTVRMVIAPS